MPPTVPAATAAAVATNPLFKNSRRSGFSIITVSPLLVLDKIHEPYVSLKLLV
jgi:hypothetical protein